MPGEVSAPHYHDRIVHIVSFKLSRVVTRSGIGIQLAFDSSRRIATAHYLMVEVEVEVCAGSYLPKPYRWKI
jgi:hypothetical protein